MKKDKEWLLHEIRKLPCEVQYGQGKIKAVDILPLIDQLDEPEKIVIPKFVADWIEKYIEYGYDLYPALKKMESNSRIWKKTHAWYRKNTYKFVNAYLTEEYEVEEEKKYYVDLDTAAYVAKWNGDNQVRIYTDGVFGSDEFEFHLTEKEIKDYDERYWPFAVEVAE